MEAACAARRRLPRKSREASEIRVDKSPQMADGEGLMPNHSFSCCQIISKIFFVFINNYLLFVRDIFSKSDHRAQPPMFSNANGGPAHLD